MRKIVFYLNCLVMLQCLMASNVLAQEAIASEINIVNPFAREISSPYNWIRNGSFEKFDDGTTLPPNDWEDASGGTIAQNTTQVKFGQASLSLTNGDIVYRVEDFKGLEGREVIFGVWVKSTAAGAVFLSLYNGTMEIEESTDSYSQVGEWQFLTVKTALPDSISNLVLYISNNSATTAYFDGAALYQTTNNLDFVPNPQDEVAAGGGETGTASDVVCTDCVGASDIADGLGVSEIDESLIQKRVTGTCSSTDQSIKTIDTNGAVTCETDDKGITTESDPKVGTLTSSYVPKWGGSYLSNSKIYDNGTSVGIGTTSPSSLYILDVSGNFRASDITCSNCLGTAEINESEILTLISESCSGTNQSIKTIDLSGNVTCETDDGSAAETDPQVGTITTSYVPRWDGSALVTGKIYDNGSKVGIGTASPAEMLHVVGNIKLEGTTTKIIPTGDLCIGTCP